MATASVSAASDSQFSVSGGDRVASRWAWTVLRVACLTFQAVLDLASALIPQNGGLPEAASLTGRLHLCALKREPCLPASFPTLCSLGLSPGSWSAVRGRAGALSGMLKQSFIGHVSVTASEDR